MWQSVNFAFPADHPTAAGHFPSNPIIPGALLLDRALVAIMGGTARGGVTIRVIKFLTPVQPGEDLTLRWRSLPDGAVSFECELVGHGMAMSGTIKIDPPA